MSKEEGKDPPNPPRRKPSDNLHPLSFVYHAPSKGQVQVMEVFTSTLKDLIQFIDENCPPSAEMTLALRELEAARMRFNQAVVLRGTLVETLDAEKQAKKEDKNV